MPKGELPSRPGARSVTLADVARKVGLHHTTVSQILNNRSNCWASKQTRERVHQAVKELGYRPNLSARALRSGRSHVVGLVMPGFQFNALQSRPVGLTQAAAISGYTVTLSAHPNDAESEDKVIRRLVDRSVDGLVVYPVDTGPHEELQALVQEGFPVVTFDGASLLDFDCDDVSVDYQAVARTQVQHLMDVGRRRICIANPVPAAVVNSIRHEAARREIEALGEEPALMMTVAYPVDAEFFDPGPMYREIVQFIRQHAGAFDAVLSHDSMAALVIQALLEQGLRVPEDVAVIGAGESLLASYNSLPITSVSTHDDWAGASAFDLLLDRIEGRANDGFHRLVSQTTLNVRRSTAGFAPQD